MKNQNSVRDDIFQFLKANGVLTLATSENNMPWVCTLYYGMDEQMNLYLVTDPRNIHGKQIAKNQNVAFSIFDSHQKITEPKRGIQGKGKIEILKGLKDITQGLWLWHKGNPGIETKITIKDILKKITDTRVYKITPTYLKFFNKELYKPEEYGILNLE